MRNWLDLEFKDTFYPYYCAREVVANVHLSNSKTSEDGDKRGKATIEIRFNVSVEWYAPENHKWHSQKFLPSITLHRFEFKKLLGQEGYGHK